MPEIVMPEILPGAEPWSTDGSGPGAPGALCIHGFTGNPTSMRPVAEAFAAAGFAVELPRLPGHGTTVEDMLTTSWEDWSAEAEAAYQRLAARAGKVEGLVFRALKERPISAQGKRRLRLPKPSDALGNRRPLYPTSPERAF